MKGFILFFFLFLALAAVSQPTISVTPVMTGLAAPMQVVGVPDSTKRVFVAQKSGTIRGYNRLDSFLGNFLTVTGLSTSGERGLLSMAFHPDYTNNGFFYVYYTNSAGDLELARYKVSSNPNVADASSKKVLITIPHPNFNNHNGGTLHFGADNHLYLSTGDGGGTGDTANNAQNTSRFLGKLLRFAVDTSDIAPYYSVPQDNPFGNLVYAYGLRNPFRWSFDRETHDLWIGDVGQSRKEEIDHRVADSIKGTNFGWRCYEGDSIYNSNGCGNISNYTFPVYFYRTPIPDGAVTGGVVYRGETYLALKGYYLASDFYSGNFYLILYDSANHTHTASIQNSVLAGITNFGETPAGEIYASCINNGTVYKLMASGPVRYTFTGNGNWNVANNWSNKTIPPNPLPSGSEIVINPSANGECILNVAQTISQGATITVQDNRRFRLLGNLTIQ